MAMKSAHPLSRCHRTRWVFALELEDGTVRWLGGHSSREKDGHRETCVLLVPIDEAIHYDTAELHHMAWPSLIRSHRRNFGEIRRGCIHQAHKAPVFADSPRTETD